MLKFSGKPVYKGVALGPVAVLKPHDQQKGQRLRMLMKKSSGWEKRGNGQGCSLQPFTIRRSKKSGKPVPRFLKYIR